MENKEFQGYKAMKATALLFLTLLAFVTSSNSSLAEERSFDALGSGIMLCHKWLNIRHYEPAQSYLVSWAFGALSRVNMEGYLNNRQQFRVDLFTEDYVLRTVNTFCDKEKNKDEVLWVPIFNSLKDFPMR